MSSKERLGVSWRRVCSDVSLVGRAHAEGEEEEHEEDLGDPHADVGSVVVGHGPHECAGGRGEGAGAEVHGVAAEEEGAGDDEDSELEDAGEQGAVHAADSVSVSPGTDEHNERVDNNDAEGGSVENGNDGETGAGCLAVDVAVLDKLNV